MLINIFAWLLFGLIAMFVLVPCFAIGMVIGANR